VLAEDMLVPMIIAGPGIRNGTMEAARTVDIAPTVVEMLEPAKLETVRMDGKSILSELRSAK